MSERDIVLLPQQNVALEDVKRLANIILALRTEVFKEGHDFGKIPGTGDKPTLLQPGMEKLCRALRVVPRYIEQCVIRDYDKPLFHFEYLCELVDVDTGKIVPGGSGIGLCTSMESKYRYRKASRVCPNCEKETIIKGKEEYGGGWVCYAKKGGCGAKFKDGDVVIESQVEGRVINEDIFDQINTIAKMSQKRALSSAIKGAANVSEFFTVDLEDFERYDMPITVSIDDGRTVDTTTGELTPAPMQTTPLQSGSQWTKTHEATSPKAMREREAQTVDPETGKQPIVRTTNVQINDEGVEVVAFELPVDEFDDIALSTRTPQQPEIGLVDVPKHPKNARTWDIGKVKTHTIQDRKHIPVKGATPHFDALIAKLESSLRITDTSATEEVCAAIDAYYAEKLKATG